MVAEALLIVVDGPPYEKGDSLPLQKEVTLIGRIWQDHVPDISFENPRISRNHAEIVRQNNCYVIRDLPSSRHGTELNGKPLHKDVPSELKHDDTIGLAKGTVTLRFYYQAEAGKTVDLEESRAGYLSNCKSYDISQSIIVNKDRREVLLDGNELIPRITGREFEMILLLYENRGKAVSHNEIISRVWADITNREGYTQQDVNVVAHRLRKSLGKYGNCIISIPAFGYRMD